MCCLITNSVLLNQRPVEVGNDFLFVNTSWTTFHFYKRAVTCEMPLSVGLPSFTVFHNKFIILIKKNKWRNNEIWRNTSGYVKDVADWEDWFVSVQLLSQGFFSTSPGQRNSRKDCCLSVRSDPRAPVLLLFCLLTFRGQLRPFRCAQIYTAFQSRPTQHNTVYNNIHCILKNRL